MINFLNEMLRHLFLTGMCEDFTETSQVSFDLPDEKFRSQVKTLGKNVLNVCLVDLKENRSQAVMEAPRQSKDANVGARVTRRRVDCHYLISAWSPATRSVEPSLDEHALLYDAMALLVEAEPLIPREIYGSKPLPRNFPVALHDAQLPSVLSPTERFPKIGEFWSAARGVYWKPTIHLVVTLPVMTRPDRNEKNASRPHAEKFGLPVVRVM